MNVIINGKEATLDDGTTVLALLTARGLAGRRQTLELNGEILPKSASAEHLLKAGKSLEVMHAVGGG